MTDFTAFRAEAQRRLFARLPEHVERLGWSAERIAGHQRDGLRALLRVAVEASPFHARRLDGVDPATFELDDLAGLPPMTKGDLMAEFDDVVTDRRLTRDAAEAAIASPGPEPAVLPGGRVCLTSGGSSGQRGVFVLDIDAFVDFGCATLRPAAARGGVPGTIALVAASSPVHMTGIAPKVLEGTPVEFVPVPATLPVADIVARLNELQPAQLFGYPSVLARLAREQAAGRLRISPVSVTASSEMLLDEHRRTITDVFGPNLVNTFGSTEGLLGHAGPGDNAFTFASDLCIVELVDEDDRPVADGTPSAKVLVTNLANAAQPLIRYELNDRFVRRPAPPGSGHLRASVEGRADELLRFGAVDVHPHVVRSVLLRTPAIADYQVRQTPAGIDVAVVADPCPDLDAVRDGLRSALAGVGLPDAEVVVRSVADLERHERTGKLRRTIAGPADTAVAARSPGGS